VSASASVPDAAGIDAVEDKLLSSSEWRKLDGALRAVAVVDGAGASSMRLPQSALMGFLDLLGFHRRRLRGGPVQRLHSASTATVSELAPPAERRQGFAAADDSSPFELAG